MSDPSVTGDPRRAFQFIETNDRGKKPRTVGVTEIRGPYYTPMGPNYLADVLSTMGHYVDSLKFAGGSFSLMPEAEVRALLELAHEHEVLVSTGGFMEYVLTQGREAVSQYVDECARLGFDIIEISAGFITLPTDDWLRLIDLVQEAGVKAKPEVGIQHGAGGGATTTDELEQIGQQDPAQAIAQARRFIEAGVHQIMIESEGITENVPEMRTEIPARFIDELGLEHLMFEAADPHVFPWYIQNYGPEVNLFVDHSQIVQLECLRSGLWGPHDLFGRVHTFKG